MNMTNFSSLACAQTDWMAQILEKDTFKEELFWTLFKTFSELENSEISLENSETFLKKGAKLSKSV
jgi:exonuclease VII small subunit